MTSAPKQIRIVRWSGGQHPSNTAITRLLEAEGLRPYRWENTANHRYPVRSHGYDRVLMVVTGSLEVAFPDLNQVVKLSPGDRADIPAGTRHALTAGARGLTCIEAAVDSRPATRRTQEVPPVSPRR